MQIQVNGAGFNVLQQTSIVNPQSSVSLLFLHYFGGSSREWCAVLDQLGAAYRCIAPDLRGFGASDAPRQGYNVREAADDVAALIDVLGLERYVLIGHSMGGKIALELAARRPDGLQSLVLLAPSPPSPEPMEDAARAQLLSTHPGRAAAEATLDKIAACPLPDGVREHVIADNLQSAPAAWRAWLEVGSREDITAHMGRIDVPVLVAAGECDAGMTPDLLQREVVARLAEARLVVVPGAAHLLPLEAPTAVAALIREALADDLLAPAPPIKRQPRLSGA